MRIEVLVTDENPVFHDLTKPKMIVGSDLGCDVIISHPDVSRQHVIIMGEGDQYFVMDRGSTNGTYINEERLIPGRRVEFNSFFPIRLGTDILISLVSEEEGFEETSNPKKIEIPIPKTLIDKAKTSGSNSDSTRVVSLKDLKLAKTETLVKRRTEIKKTETSKKVEKAKPKKKGFKMTSVHWAALVVVAVGVWLNNPFKKEVVVAPVVEAPIEVGEDGRVIQKGKEGEEKQKVEDKSAELVNVVSFVKSLFSSPKCDSSQSAVVCEALTKYTGAPWGASIVDKKIFLFIDATPYLADAKNLLVPPVEPEVNAEGPAEPSGEVPERKDPESKADWFRVAAAFFLIDGIKPETDLAKFENQELYIGLFSSENPQSLGALIQIKPSELQSLKVVLLKRRLLAIGSKPRQLDFTKGFYRLYTPFNDEAP